MACEENGFSFLPNELVLKIFQYCGDMDIINVGEAFDSERLWDIISTVKLLKSAVISPSECRKFSKYRGKHTSKLKIKGTYLIKGTTEDKNLTQSDISSICQNCPELSHFTVESCVLDTPVMFSLLPKTLTFLKLSCIKVNYLRQMTLDAQASPRFSGIKSSLPHLRTLSLSMPLIPENKEEEYCVEGGGNKILIALI